MPFKLAAHCAFFRSPQAPTMCLFSGRVDRVQPQPLPLRQPAGTGADTGNLRVPCAPGELLRWRFRRLRGYLPLALSVLGGAALAGLYSHPQNALFAPLGAVGLVALGGLASSILHPLAQRHCIRIGFTDRLGNLAVIFPSSREHVFWAYQKAHHDWLQIHPEFTPPATASGSRMPAKPAQAL